MASFTQYRAVEGDRWDTIAGKAYGDPFKYIGIIRANKPLAIAPTIPAGTQINIPILEEEDGDVVGLLPPWKRGEG